MRTLLILRGCMGAGKSTFVQQNGLEAYTLSPDAIRNSISSPTLQMDGEFKVTMHQEHKVWDMLMSLLEDRMSRGEFTVIDATHKDVESIAVYRDLAVTYRYRIFVLTIKADLETCLKQNKLRPTWKQVPDAIIESTYAKIEAVELPNWCKQINSLDEIKNYWFNDLTEQYEEVKVIGDIQGCYNVLINAIGNNGKLNDKIKYVFIGDFLDRGIQNKEVFEYMLSIYSLPNVVLLEGNHEMHLNNFANFNEIRNVGFILETLPELLSIDKNIINEKINIEKQNKNVYKLNNKEILDIVLSCSNHKDVEKLRMDCKRLYQRCNQAYMFKFHDKKFFCNHGGITSVPELVYVSTRTLITGVGKHNEGDLVAEQYKINFYQGKCQDFIQVFGHRNAKSNEVCINLIDSNINHVENNGKYSLEYNGVEYGGKLPVLCITPNNYEVKFYQNDIYQLPTVHHSYTKKIVDKDTTSVAKKYFTNNEEINELLQNTDLIDIKEQLDKNGNNLYNMISINFKNKVFDKKIWNESTIKARGLFVDKITGEVKLRSYDKFFNYSERVKMTVSQQDLTYPVKAYIKYNGFLGIMSTINNDLVLASKKTIYGTFKDYFEEIWNIESQSLHQIFKNVSQKYNCSFTFEVIHPNDPHIIDYNNQPQLVLLDAIPNQLHYNAAELDNYSNGIIDEIFQQINEHNVTVNALKRKELYKVCYNAEELDNLINDNKKLQIEEGFVFVDSSGNMLKDKNSFYKRWKSCRYLASKFAERPKERFSFGKCYSPTETHFMKWLTQKPHEELEKMGFDLTPVHHSNYKKQHSWNIIDLRNRFLAETTYNE